MQVYAAWLEGVPVAVKMLKPELLDEEKQIRAFVQEIRILHSARWAAKATLLLH